MTRNAPSRYVPAPDLLDRGAAAGGGGDAEHELAPRNARPRSAARA